MNEIAAFPTFGVQQDNGIPIYFRQTGMTLKDYFAGQALIGMVHRMGMEEDMHSRNSVARYCYGYANAMLEARKTV